MKWQEARELFLNQFLLVSILDYHEEDELSKGKPMEKILRS
ncbi:DUF2200 domain-containing protein [Neobacillus sp. C211]|jgi:hypothetical protein|nr:DUF2200 domain-containing protein [Bacillus sp. ISL-7]